MRLGSIVVLHMRLPLFIIRITPTSLLSFAYGLFHFLSRDKIPPTAVSVTPHPNNFVLSLRSCFFRRLQTYARCSLPPCGMSFSPLGRRMACCLGGERSSMSEVTRSAARYVAFYSCVLITWCTYYERGVITCGLVLGKPGVL